MIYDDDPSKMADDLYGAESWEQQEEEAERIPDPTDPNADFTEEQDDDTRRNRTRPRRR